MRHLTTVAALVAFAAPTPAADGVFVRFRLTEPKTAYSVALGGHIHREPWYLPRAAVPVGADKDAAKKTPAGEWTPWFDLGSHAGKALHGRMNRAGGVAEFPNVTAEFASGATGRHTTDIELATRPDAAAVVKRWHESFDGPLTSFLVSPTLVKDAKDLESAAEMTARRLKWAREATGGKAVTPKKLILQTQFWAPQRKELNLQEAEVLRLLGFNVVGNQPPEVAALGHFRVPGHTHDAPFAPGVTRAQIDESMRKQAAADKTKYAAGVPFNFSDEITCGTIGDDKQALAHFHAYLAAKGVKPADLGVAALTDVVPIETPDALRARQAKDVKAANRVFYHTSRFRQAATTERFRWLTESFHKHYGPGPLTSTLVADHPYFSGTGLGMGMGPNPAWGRPALAADWFDLARSKAVDMGGIEDWMGLQYMYGPNFTFEGFQLMGFQAAMFRSASRGTLPVQAWVTPSDATNLRLKWASALAQGAKHLFFWCYGPTATGTENYWSDLRGAYDGMAAVSRQMAFAEDIIAPGKRRPGRVALLYSVSSDLWQPFGYVHMLERRGLYLALTHAQYSVDMLTEEDVEAGRLADYPILYTADPCIRQTAMDKIAAWVKSGGMLYGTCAAGSRNEFNEEVPGLAAVFGIEPVKDVTVQPGAYYVRGALNGIPYLDRVTHDGKDLFGAIGVKVTTKPVGPADVSFRFADGTPATVEHKPVGRGVAFYVTACPGMAYIKDAKFVPRALKERWPQTTRQLITGVNGLIIHGHRADAELSHPVVETGVYDTVDGLALVLGNFTYDPIDALNVKLYLPRPAKSVRSAEQGDIKFMPAVVTPLKHPPGYPHAVTFTMKLGLSDIILIK